MTQVQIQKQTPQGGHSRPDPTPSVQSRACKTPPKIAQGVCRLRCTGKGTWTRSSRPRAFETRCVLSPRRGWCSCERAMACWPLALPPAPRCRGALTCSLNWQELRTGAGGGCCQAKPELFVQRLLFAGLCHVQAVKQHQIVISAAVRSHPWLWGGFRLGFCFFFFSFFHLLLLGLVFVIQMDRSWRGAVPRVGDGRGKLLCNSWGSSALG